MHTVKWLNSSIWLINRTLTSITTLGQSRAESNGNELVLHTLLRWKTGASSSDVLVSYAGYSLEGEVSYPFAEMQSVYSTAPANGAVREMVLLINKNELEFTQLASRMKMVKDVMTSMMQKVWCVWMNAHTHMHARVIKKVKVSKVGNHSRGQPEGSFFNCYYTKM